MDKANVKCHYLGNWGKITRKIVLYYYCILSVSLKCLNKKLKKKKEILLQSRAEKWGKVPGGECGMRKVSVFIFFGQETRENVYSMRSEELIQKQSPWEDAGTGIQSTGERSTLKLLEPKDAESLSLVVGVRRRNGKEMKFLSNRLCSIK